jgi:hypothetical protein
MVEKGMPERLEVKRTFRRLTGYLSWVGRWIKNSVNGEKLSKSIVQ